MEMPGQLIPGPDRPKKSIIKRLLVVLACVVAVGVWIITRSLGSLGPGSVSVSISGHTQFAAGDAEKIKVTMNSVHGDPLWTSVDWGDGRKDSNPNKTEQFRRPCDTTFTGVQVGTPRPIPYVNVADLSPGHGYVEFIHRYRQPGTYRVAVRADEFFWVCTKQRSPSGSMSIILHVTGPAAPGNGPGDPRPTLGLNSFDNKYVLTGYFTADDPDGYIRSLTVTWIDGTTHVYNNDASCEEPANGWVGSTMGFRWRKRVNPGYYVIKISALSTDCKDGNQQKITLIAPFRASPTMDRIYWGTSELVPHAPRIDGDSSIPMTYDFYPSYDPPFRPAP